MSVESVSSNGGFGQLDLHIKQLKQCKPLSEQEVRGKKSAPQGTKGMVYEQISQAVLSTSNLLHLMQESSPTQGLVRLPKNLLGKSPNIKNTEQILHQMPHIISSLDAHLDKVLECASELQTIRCLLVSKESSGTHLSIPSDEDSTSSVTHLSIPSNEDSATPT